MVSFNTFDRVLKVMARNYADQFLQLVFPNVAVKLIGTLENVEIALPEERVDFVHRLLCAGQEYLFHLEFQLQHRDDIPRRQFLYSAALTRQFDLPVVTAVLYLKRRIAPIPNEYVVQLGGKVANCFTYPVLKL
ncbi:MAG: hypothetical protein DRH12_14120, partial [Deltaproteobacteria bacterium]